MSKLPYGGYTQREWERAVGWGKVPPEYEHEETQYKLNDPIWDKRWIPENKHEETKYKLNDPIWDKRWIPETKYEESDNDEEVQTPEDKSTRDKSENN